MNAIAALSPYASVIGKSNTERHTLSVLVDNEPGVLARVVGLFSGRGYNIESLTVAEVAHGEHLSRITIVTAGTPEVIEQITHQLERIVPIHRVTDLSIQDRVIERELAMIKVQGTGEHRSEALRLSEAFRAKVIDATIESFISELTGSPGKIVPLKDTIKGFKAIVNGEYDHLPEQAFYMVGTIEEAVENAKKFQ